MGGVLEHPFKSKLWKHCDLPRNGSPPDAWGGFTIDVDQFWFGHRCRKRTWLYIVGVDRRTIPGPSLRLGEPPAVIASSRKRWAAGRVIHVCKADREHSPPAFAAWLVAIARNSARASVALPLGNYTKLPSRVDL